MKRKEIFDLMKVIGGSIKEENNRIYCVIDGKNVRHYDFEYVRTNDRQNFKDDETEFVLSLNSLAKLMAQDK